MDISWLLIRLCIFAFFDFFIVEKFLEPFVECISTSCIIYQFTHYE